MTEEQWLAATDPAPMQEFLHGKMSDRKLRLLIVAYVRIAWSQHKSHEDAQPAWRALQVAEDYSDALASRLDLRNAHTAVRTAPVSHELFINLLSIYASAATQEKVHDPFIVSSASDYSPRTGPSPSIIIGANCSDRCRFLRDIFGNPFRPVTLDRSWLTSTVLALAAGLDEEKAFDRMPILADALQDAGCDNEDVLNHCRQPSEHVRGCWVLDLLTGRS